MESGKNNSVQEAKKTSTGAAMFGFIRGASARAAGVQRTTEKGFLALLPHY